MELHPSRLEDVENQVKGLSAEELKSFRNWFANFDGEIWDAQIAADVRSGKLRSLAEKALRDHEDGRSSLL